MSDDKFKIFDAEQIKQELVNRPIKEELIKVFREGNVVLFIGAGLSVNLGLPDWEKFAYDYLSFLYSDCKQKNILDYKTYSQLKNEDFKTILSLCRDIHENLHFCNLSRKFNEWFRVNICKEDLDGLNDADIKKVLEYKKNALEKIKKADSVFRKVYDLNEIFITTNYDDILDILVEEKNKERSVETYKTEYKKNEVFYKEEDFNIDDTKLKKGDVFHIHGSIKDVDKLIVSVEDYIERYWGENNSYKSFLDSIFKNYNIIFIGYSLKEVEILQYMFKGFSITGKKRYMIVDCYADEYLKINILNRYYKNNYNVELIPYDKTEEGYKELEKIVDGLTLIKDEAILKKKIYMDNLEFIRRL